MTEPDPVVTLEPSEGGENGTPVVNPIPVTDAATMRLQMVMAWALDVVLVVGLLVLCALGKIDHGVCFGLIGVLVGGAGVKRAFHGTPAANNASSSAGVGAASVLLLLAVGARAYARSKGLLG